MRKILFFAIFLYGGFSITDVVDESGRKICLDNNVKIGNGFLKYKTPIERIQRLISVLKNLSRLNQKPESEMPVEEYGDAFKEEYGDAFKIENKKCKLDCDCEVLKRLLLCDEYFAVKECVESKKAFVSQCGIELIVENSNTLKAAIQRSYINELGQVRGELCKLNECLNKYNSEICLNYTTQWSNLEYITEDLGQLYDELSELRSQYEGAIKKAEEEKARNALINYIAEKGEAMVKKENELKIRKAREALINFNPISVVQLSFKPKYTQSIIVHPIKTLRNCYMQANPLKNMINKQIKCIFDAETPIERILLLRDLVKLMKGNMVGNYKLNCDLDLLKNLIFGDNYYSKRHLLEEDFFEEFGNCMKKNIKIEELPSLIEELNKLKQSLSSGAFIVQCDSLNDLIKELQNLYNSFIKQTRLARKSEKHKRKLDAKEKKEKRTTRYRDAELRNARKKAEKGYLKMISKESIMNTEKLVIPQMFADEGLFEEKHFKSEEEQLKKIEEERGKMQKELNCKIKVLMDDKKLTINEVKQLDVIKNKKVRQQNIVQQHAERKVLNRRNNVITSNKKISNRKFVTKTIGIKTNNNSNVRNKNNVKKNSKDNLRYIGMRSTNVDGKIILPEEYVKLPLFMQKEYTVYEE